MTDLNHQQQTSPDTENTETQQGGHTHHTKNKLSATIGKRQTNHTLDTILTRPAKRTKESTGEYAKPNTTDTPHGDTPAGGSGDAASLTTNEAEKNVLANATFSIIAQTTHGLQTRAGEADEVQRQKSPTTPPRQTIHGDLVRRLGPPQDHSSYASRGIYYRDNTHKYTKEIQQTKIRIR